MSLASAIFKREPDDFQVQELLGFEPDGEGEHLFVLIRRRGMTTAEVVRRLAQIAKVPQRHISFSGTKDKHALVEQWFSIWLPGKTVDAQQFNVSPLAVITSGRHRKKLKRGTHKYNCFSILLRAIDGDKTAIEEQLSHIQTHGFENRFGYQRFGIDNSNLRRADSCTDIGSLGRQERSFLLSAIRAKLFNDVLDKRLHLFGDLNLRVGDIAMFSDSNSQFLVNELTPDIEARQQAGDIVASGPLWGAGGSAGLGESAQLENSVAKANSHYCLLLDQARMASDRRPLKVYARAFTWQWQGDSLRLQFELPKSAYATTLLAGVFSLNEERAH